MNITPVIIVIVVVVAAIVVVAVVVVAVVLICYKICCNTEIASAVSLRTTKVNELTYTTNRGPSAAPSTDSQRPLHFIHSNRPCSEVQCPKDHVQSWPTGLRGAGGVLNNRRTFCLLVFFPICTSLIFSPDVILCG